MAQKKVTEDHPRKKASQLKRDAAYSQKLFLIFSHGSERLKRTARITIDAWLEMEGLQRGKSGVQ